MRETGFGRQRIQADVPGIREYGVDSLAIEGQPDQARTLPRFAHAAEGQCAIVESAPHPQPPAAAVHTHEGDDDEIEPPWRGPSKVPRRDAMRYRDAEGAAPRLARQGLKTQAPVAQVDDDRDEDADPTPARGVQQRGRIGFAVEGQIGSDPGACLESWQPGDGGRSASRAERVLRILKEAALGAQLFT